MAREQAAAIAGGIAVQGGPRGLEDKEIVALIAYLQRLGRDARATGIAQAAPPSPEVTR
jgi:cytochrome c oxidase cbb3-type subunit I/II